MPVPTHIRNKIIEWINQGISYTEIIDKVKNEGYSISRGGITHIKKTSGSAFSEQTTKQTKQNEDQKIEKSVITDISKIPQNYDKDKVELNRQKEYKELLTELEFQNFSDNFNVIYNSNIKRLQNYRATGILNALNSMKYTIEIIKKRGNFK